jgi:phage recombination protein Bet
MNAVIKAEPGLPAPVARRGITEAQWRTMMNNLFPGAKAESVIMVWDYCAARKLDPLKKPCHIVPMQVRTHEGDYVWRDVVMPGIYEYRTTATRTGLYLGHSKPEYGPEADFLGVKAPAWCEIVIYRWNSEAKMRSEYPVRVKFAECCGTAKDKKTGDLYVNGRWSRAPEQMLTKCTEAAGLREAFPDELGGTHTAEELQDQAPIDITPEKKIPGADPRGDLSDVDFELRDKCVSSIADLLNADKEEREISVLLNEYIAEHLQKFPELYITVLDKLAADKIISKANFKRYLRVAEEAPAE